MAFRWVVNAGLLAVPIGGTIGVLVGIDAGRQAKGQQPLFAGGGNNGGGLGGSGSGSGSGSSGTGSNNNGISFEQYCQLSYGIDPPTKGEPYVLNPNQWGVTTGESSLCMNVTWFNNGTYATNTTGPEFSATWNYTQSLNNDLLVHAFPNIMSNSSVLPVALQDILHVNLEVQWSYAVGDTPSNTTDIDSLTTEALNANVAVDMFMDSNPTTASNSSAAKYEIMVWLARFGDTVDPVGFGDGIRTTQVVNGTTFNLYYGTNLQNQNVLTWIAATTVENFVADLTPFFSRPAAISADDYPATTDYLGHFSFGSEAFYSNKNVTFYVPQFSIDFQT